MIIGIAQLILAFAWFAMAVFNENPSRASYRTAAICAALGCLAVAIRNMWG